MNTEEQIREYRNEITKIIKSKGYTKVDGLGETQPKTYYIWKGLNIVVSKNLSFHIVTKNETLGLGRFVTCLTKNGVSEMVGTYVPDFFFPVLFQFLRDEITEEEAIDLILE